MAKRANKRRSQTKRQRKASRRPGSSPSAPIRSTASTVPVDDDPLDDPFFYESPFPPEVELDAIEIVERPPTYTPAMMARRRKLRTFVAMVVGVAAVITAAGLSKSMLQESGDSSPNVVAR